jgi:4-alpha-glucanotransferase
VVKSGAQVERRAGVMAPLFSLRTGADAGIGDIAALGAMVDFAAAMHHRAILLLPIDETSPGEASPYSALSVFAIDPIYIALDDLPGVASRELARVRESLAHVPLSDRLTVRAARRGLLEAAFQSFTLEGQDRAAVEDFARGNREWLHDYALFRALKDRFDFAPWEHWPEDLRRREPSALERARKELANVVDKYVFWQFLAHRQWAAVRVRARDQDVRLGGDLAFSPGRDSAEVWANQELFNLGRTVGAPPDAFNPQGQHWGLPSPDWDRIRADNFALVRRRARHAHDLYDFVRIDHVVGLYRTFSFGPGPEDRGAFQPSDESEQRAQGEAVIRAILEESGTTIVVAEDLGVVPAFVRSSLAALGVPGYKVFRWEKISENTSAESYVPPAEYPAISLATTGTHDTDTLVEWWEQATAEERERILRMLKLAPDDARDAEAVFDEVRDAILVALYESPSQMVIIPIQDLFGWRERINLPGTISAANWSWRMPANIEDLAETSAVALRISQMRELALNCGR